MVKKVAIVGAGPCGVLLAHYLLQREDKYQVDIFDFRSDPRIIAFAKTRTFPITLSERGMSALRQISGLEAAVKAISLVVKGGVFHESNGKVRVINRKYPLWSLDRTNLVITLLTELTRKFAENRVNIYFNYQCTKVDFVNQQITFKTPDSATEVDFNYDLLIGADGSRSVVRESFFNTDNFECEQQYTPNDYKSIFLPTPNPQLGWQKGKVHSWRQDDGTTILLVYQLDASMSGVVLFPHDKNSITELTTQAAVRDYFQHNFPEIGQIMPDAEAEEFAKRTAARVLTIRCDRYHQNDSVLLMGDAAHAVSPSLGQGCNAALEDVLIFQQILDEYHDNLALALAQFTIRRQADAHALVELSNYGVPTSRKLFLELLLRNSLSKFLHPIWPRFFLPSLFELTAENKLSYSAIFDLYQDWIAKVKRVIGNG
ncbi:NAD(P)/FAD-dependent oxidoreductase [Nostoc sp. TCL26-01]|uniref:FAD-dependent oxidoreductase n=1 Tax=Nostoc sp. TCL26-01 TaxID=2576904 RepID=UPI0015C09D92|nr:NAD(P)/FAD-dependent oxidoreductase [Nostoc sp. TCL26-01]QLE58418.1 FAD-dependent monooxygenase [Nostoc sp. TCL26-01]